MKMETVEVGKRFFWERVESGADLQTRKSVAARMGVELDIQEGPGLVYFYVPTGRVRAIRSGFTPGVICAIPEDYKRVIKAELIPPGYACVRTRVKKARDVTSYLNEVLDRV